LGETLCGTDPSHVYSARRWLERALSALKADDRALITLYEIDGWPIGDLARLFRRPQGTIKARLSRARKRMRKTIEDYLSAASAETLTIERGVEYAVQQKKQNRE
jgi:RNA polymerase sigma-70 factor (ECF subfamily)